LHPQNIVTPSAEPDPFFGTTAIPCGVPLKVVFGIVAHREAGAVADLIENLSQTCPNCDTIVFDGADDPTWRDGADFRVASGSRPLRWGYLSDVHYALMRELHESRADFDCLVVLDSDMLMIRSGYEGQLASYIDQFAYLGYELRMVHLRGEWMIGRRFLYHWKKHWQPLLDAKVPFGVFNPGQVFRRDLCERLALDPTLPRLLDAVRTARSTALEEIVYPTLAIARGFPATSLPGAHAVGLRTYSRPELQMFAADPSVYLIHKVSLETDSDDRLAIHDLVAHPPERTTPLPAPVPEEHRIGHRSGGLRWLARTARDDARIYFLGP
jgi:hypothetical protein